MKFKLLVLALFSGSVLFAQDVPPAVDQAFKKQFPVVTDANWKMKDNVTHSVSFYENEIYKVASYTQDGKWSMITTYMYSNNLPENIRKVIEDKYPNGIITEIQFVEFPMLQYYDVYVETDEDYWYIQLDKSGKINKSEKILDDY